jgi:AcrR family transcriptional regulator
MRTDPEEKAGQGNDLRERIVRASVELLEEQGLSALSMREVARRAGVSHQAPYHHFEDREAILGAIAEQGFRMLFERLEAATNSKNKSIQERISGAGLAYVQFALENQAHFRVMFRPELVDIENCPGAKAEGDRAFTSLKECVHEAVLAGLPAEPSEEALVLMCWSVAHGLACLALDGPLAVKVPEEQHKELIYGVMHSYGRLLSGTAERASKDSKVEPKTEARGPLREQNTQAARPTKKRTR